MGLAEFPGFDDAMRLRLAAATDGLAKEFEGIYDRPAIAAIVDESAQRLSSRGVTPFVHILAERFARERLRGQAQSEGHLEKDVPEVLFVSLTGGGRAQIGAALLARQTAQLVSVHSAGSVAAPEIDENVRAAMQELDVDLQDAFSRPLTPEVLASADIVVTMGRSVGDVVGDPAGAPIDEVRRVRDDIERRIAALAEELTAAQAASAA